MEDLLGEESSSLLVEVHESWEVVGEQNGSDEDIGDRWYGTIDLELP